jgi:adenine-specific DNA-methyltransferase
MNASTDSSRVDIALTKELFEQSSPAKNGTSDHAIRRGALERRPLGIYYTPQTLAQAIADWAIRNSTDTILEPSFGGCGFLAAACRRLRSLGCRAPAKRTAGCDVDDAAFLSLSALVGSNIPGGHFLKQDFLATEPGSFAIRAFDCILGNPPFVRHHQIERLMKAEIHERRSTGMVELPGTAGLWAHFVVHSMGYLKPAGRMGLVLPGALLFADYAEPLRQFIRRHFSRVGVLRLNYRAFQPEGAEERAVILLAEDFGENRSAAWSESVVWSDASAVEALQLLQHDETLQVGDVGERSPDGGDVSASLSNDLHAIELGSIAKIDIGVVTGANRYFVVSRDTVLRFDLPETTLTPIVSRTAQIPGLIFSKSDHRRALDTGAACWLFAPPDLGQRHASIRRYLATVPRERRRTTAWFTKRSRWYSPEVGPMPDATLTYMNHLGPRLVLLERDATCTNTLHRVSFGPGGPPSKLVALSLLTSFSQLSAERQGRFYGGGVLKIEPRGARKIKLVVPNGLSTGEVSRAFKRVDSALRAGQDQDATDIADDILLRPILGAHFPSIRASLLDDLARMRRIRHGS